jgi:hypothetical protein
MLNMPDARRAELRVHDSNESGRSPPVLSRDQTGVEEVHSHHHHHCHVKFRVGKDS